jgi:hypothetical protein
MQLLSSVSAVSHQLTWCCCVLLLLLLLLCFAELP